MASINCNTVDPQNLPDLQTVRKVEAELQEIMQQYANDANYHLDLGHYHFWYNSTEAQGVRELLVMTWTLDQKTTDKMMHEFMIVAQKYLPQGSYKRYSYNWSNPWLDRPKTRGNRFKVYYRSSS